MRRWSLGVVLPVVTAVLVVAVVVSIGTWAAALLKRLGDEQAIARARAAGQAAMREIRRSSDEMDVAVRLLAERPTLRRQIEQARRDEQRLFLRRFSETGALSGCAAMTADTIVVGGDDGLPWDSIADPAGALDGRIALKGPEHGPVVLGAIREVDGLPGTRVACARWLDGAATDLVAREIGLPVHVVGLAEARSGSTARSLAVLRGDAAEERRSGTRRIDAIRAFVDVRPLLDPRGEAIAVVETRLDAEVVDRPLRRLIRSVRLGTGLAAALAALLALVLVRAGIRPLATLAGVAGRIGAGDLESPVPRISGAEAGRLADSMEDMRVRLSHLNAELHRRHREVAAILASIVEGVWAVDRERRITWISPQAADELGVSPAEAVGRFCGDVLQPIASAGGRPCDVACPILDARFQGRARATEHLRTPGGSPRTVVVTSTPVVEDPGGDDRDSRQYQVFRDETDVEAASRMRDAILANVSHEFRTPLSAQLASLEILRARTRDRSDAEALQLVDAMQRGTLRLVRLVDNLLESLRIDAGRDSIRRAPVELDRVVEEAVEQVAPLTVQKRQTLDVQLPWPLPPVSADLPRLVQVFTNLLANAQKFSPVGSTITIGGRVDDAEVEVWVQDEGRGFPDDAGERLFERFSRAATDEPEERGVGLGLWIARSIVDRHGGRLTARNTERGAWIAVALPRREEEGHEGPGG